MKASAKNQNNILRFIDVAVLEPKKHSLSILGILDNFSVIGNMYILTKTKYIAELMTDINSVLQKFSNISGGATILPHDSGVIIRILGIIAHDLRIVMHEIIKIVRRVILNASFSGIRKG
jgi:urease accessory protein